MTRKGWWQQLQSGEYTKTKLSYGNSDWVNFRTPTPRTPVKTSTKASPKTSPFFYTQSPGLAYKNNQLKPLLPGATKEPQITISKIKKILKDVYDAKELHELLSSYLNNLREIYKTNKTDFSTIDILFLKDANSINNSLILFINLKEELIRLPNIENPRNYFNDLLLLSKRLKETAVHRRVEREIWKFRKQYPDYSGY